MSRSLYAFCAIALLCLSACSGESVAPPKGILLITVSELRPDLTSLEGGEVSTPNLELLAADGVRYPDSWSPVPMTRPSLAALHTGVAPDRLEVRNDIHDRLPPDARPLAQVFAEAGRETVAIVPTPHASYGSGLDRGFDLFDGPERLWVGPAAYAPLAMRDDAIAKRFVTWLDGREESEFFAWVHFASLATKATAVQVATSRETYLEKLAEFDAALGTVLDTLRARDRYDSTLILLSGTHGVRLGEGDGGRGAAYWLQEETLRVPLVLKSVATDSRIAAGSIDARPVWLPDVAATLADAAGAPLASGGDGESLFRDAEREGRWAWTWAPDDEAGWPTLTAAEVDGTWRTFDGAALRQLPDGPHHEAAASRPARPRSRAIPEDLRAALTSAGVGSGEQGQEEPSPEERISLLNDLQRLRYGFSHGGTIAVPKISRKLLERSPRFLPALAHRAFFFMAAGAPEEAAALGAKLLAHYPERQDALHWAGHAAVVNADLERAELLFSAAHSIVPDDPDLAYDLACLSALGDRADEAFVRLEAAIESGFRDWQHIERDPDLASLRRDARWSALLGRYGR